MLDSVRGLLPEIAAAAAEVDQRGTVDAEVIARLHDVGYFALLQPPEFGGLDAEPDTYLTATLELSSACTSTGWLAGWLAVNNWGLSVRDERALGEVWGSDPRSLLCSSYAPNGRLERVPGGFRLSGSWARCTGARHASWLSVAAVTVGADGAAQDFMAVLVPARDYRVERAWNGLGLRGIGADDVIVTDAFVPEHRAFSWLGLSYTDAMPALQRLPQPTLYTLAGSIPLLGAAQRVLDIRPSENHRADIELSMMQIRRNVVEQLECIRSGGYPDSESMLRTRRDQVMASDRAVKAVAAAVGAADDPALERIWRDVLTARMHVASNVEQVLAVVGRHTVGIDVDDLMW
ncbi:acyl-CoA dehydrogenase family protein [Mycolicibacterium neoaurum]|uniref:acyl-CoA dehydrogenase family protein n=1 Tax=Mycolicibacterium neoaurum TaxID=1795 RepID=UPI00248A9652|nr:acyl-CoA dehydrogenase family protein [Mycolicibacterium neoaurum]WBP96453.1 acyl-CoA dehydrogenase family protein [Mycolicibacterium neoaurum]WBS10016.1 acyl-CoA dehydrogenase family protein [Mycolicibacterium neoaurum]